MPLTLRAVAPRVLPTASFCAAVFVCPAVYTAVARVVCVKYYYGVRKHVRIIIARLGSIHWGGLVATAAAA